ncbi:MAG: hypothetical protein ABI759_19515 [Candidatus Solibacter sp.]
MRYPDPDCIPDPAPELPSTVAGQVRSIILRSVVELREKLNGREILWQAAMEIFDLLTPLRLQEGHTKIESFQQGVQADIDTALACVHYSHRLAFGGRMSFLWHRDIGDRLALSPKAELMETTWWKMQKTLPVPRGTRPRNTRTPDTPTARAIEDFRRRIEAGGREVRQIDMAAYCRYTDVTMFQRVQREAPRAGKEAIANVKRMLEECQSPDRFWSTVEMNRQKSKSPGKK